MTRAIQTETRNSLPKAENGLTLPLRTFLGSQALAKHRALVALELEVLAKKMDRFGWDRDQGTATHDRLITDWMNALQDYPLDEVQAACRACVLASPNRIPNEGHVIAQIMKARALFLTLQPKKPDPEPFTALSVPVDERRRQAAEIMAGFAAASNRKGGAA